MAGVTPPQVREGTVAGMSATKSILRNLRIAQADGKISNEENKSLANIVGQKSDRKAGQALFRLARRAEKLHQKIEWNTDRIERAKSVCSMAGDALSATCTPHSASEARTVVRARVRRGGLDKKLSAIEAAYQTIFRLSSPDYFRVVGTSFHLGYYFSVNEWSVKRHQTHSLVRVEQRYNESLDELRQAVHEPGLTPVDKAHLPLAVSDAIETLPEGSVFKANEGYVVEIGTGFDDHHENEEVVRIFVSIDGQILGWKNVLKSVGAY